MLYSLARTILRFISYHMNHMLTEKTIIFFVKLYIILDKTPVKAF